MAQRRKFALYAACGLLAFLVLAAAAVLLLVDVNAYKSRLEAVASDALGMDVRIGGGLGIGFFPGFHIRLDDVHVRNRGTDLAAAKEASLGIELLPLLRKEVRIGSIGLKGPRFAIERDLHGTFNFETPAKRAGMKPGEEAEGTLPALDVEKVSLSDGTLLFTDRKSGEKIEAGEFRLDVRRLRLPGGKKSDVLNRLSFLGELDCKEIRMGNLAVSELKLAIEGKDGRYGIRRSTATRLIYSGADGKVTAEKLSLGVENLAFGGDRSAGVLRGLAFTGSGEIGEIRTKDLGVTGIKFSAGGADGVFDLKPLTMRIFGGEGSGSLRADYSGSVPLFRIRYSLPKFRLEEFLKSVSPKKTAEGPMDFSATLSMRGTTAKEMRRTATGAVSLRGEDLTLEGADIDRAFSRYEESQSFNIVDVGAYFFAGPFGPLLTKGYNFATIYRGTGGRSRIRKLVSEWSVERGVAQAKDVAMATNENRIALKGKLDFAQERFDDVTIALIDGIGCVKVRQKIHGPFGNPEVDKVSTLRSIAGPVLKLFDKTRKFLSGGQCEPFYSGSVAPPK